MEGNSFGEIKGEEESSETQDEENEELNQEITQNQKIVQYFIELIPEMTYDDLVLIEQMISNARREQALELSPTINALVLRIKTLEAKNGITPPEELKLYQDVIHLETEGSEDGKE